MRQTQNSRRKVFLVLETFLTTSQHSKPSMFSNFDCSQLFQPPYWANIRSSMINRSSKLFELIWGHFMPENTPCTLQTLISRFCTITLILVCKSRDPNNRFLSWFWPFFQYAYLPPKNSSRKIIPTKNLRIAGT